MYVEFGGIKMDNIDFKRYPHGKCVLTPGVYNDKDAPYFVKRVHMLERENYNLETNLKYEIKVENILYKTINNKDKVIKKLSKRLHNCRHDKHNLQRDNKQLNEIVDNLTNINKSHKYLINTLSHKLEKAEQRVHNLELILDKNKNAWYTDQLQKANMDLLEQNKDLKNKLDYHEHKCHTCKVSDHATDLIQENNKLKYDIKNLQKENKDMKDEKQYDVI